MTSQVGLLWDQANPNNVNVGYQLWLLGQTRTEFAVLSPRGSDRFDQSSVDWALGVWVPPTEPFTPSSNTPSIVPMTGADAHTKPYRWSSVVETWGRAILNGAAIWQRPFAEWLR